MENLSIYRQKITVRIVEENQVMYSDTLQKFSDSKTAHKIAMGFWDKDDLSMAEGFYCLYFNSQNKPICWAQISLGSLNSTIADPKVIFSHAVLCAATGFICFHNHPSGNLRPSQADIQLTKKLQNGAKLLDINLLDHIIVSPNEEEFYSFADNGEM